MFARIIAFSIRNPLIIGLGVIGIVVWGLLSFQSLPIDAVPDITNNQVQIVTLSSALAPQEVERLITVPVEQTMATIDGIVERRSISRFGLSVVTLVFEDDVDVYWARAQVDQRLSEAAELIPAGAGTPVMMPITTGLGEIFQYQLVVDAAYRKRYTPMDLRTLHDWTIRRRLLGTDGVADVASFGGFLRQVEIAVQPDRLRAFGLSLADVIEHVDRNNANSGGSYIERGPSVAYIRTEGIATSAADIEQIVIGQTEQGLPILIGDLATVRDGSAVRYGALTHNDEGESVGGIVYMLKGANSSRVIDNVKTRIAEIQQTLPAGIRIEPYLDRSDLVDRTISTVATNLVEGALIVIFVLVLMLGNLRAGFIVASVIPLSMLFAIGMMRAFGVSGNLMSLGAIDFGLIVDGAVIIVEHVLHRLHQLRSTVTSKDRLVAIQDAAVEIRRSAAFGEFIILIVYVPILTLVGIEGKMFGPMAQTVMFAILGAFLLSTTYVPMMSSLLLRNVRPSTTTIADRLMERIHRAYRPVRRFALKRPAILFSSAAAALVATALLFTTMGAEFIPQLSEGDFAVEVRLPTGSSLDQTIEVTQQASSVLLKEFPEVIQCVGKIGTTEIPLDPMPLEACDMMVILRPRSEWTTASSREELADSMSRALRRVIPGIEFGFQQPIQMRFNELMTGARQDVVVKVFGDDLDQLAAIADSIGRITNTVEGAEDVFVEPIGGLPQVVVRIDRKAAAMLGVAINDINLTVRAAFAGEQAGSVYDLEKRFDVVVRLRPEDRASIATLERLYVPSATGQLIPLPQVATVTLESGPNQIQRETGRRRIFVGFNVRDRDVQSIVDELRGRLATLSLPVGYEITYGGAFENLSAASARLLVAVPAALLLIVLLLYITFGRITETLLVFTAIPLSAIGGIAALLLRGLPFSISAGVGFIALFGVAVLNGIVLMSAFMRHEHFGTLRAVLRGTNDRLRPVMMTALVASLGFLPMAISTSDGAEVQRPLATVVIGGLVSSTLLTLVVLPALYFVVRTRRNTTRNATSTTGAAIAGVIVALGLISSVPLHAQEPTALTHQEILDLVRTRSMDVTQARLRVQQAELLKGAAVDLGPTSVTWMGGQYNADDFDNSFTIEQSIPFPTRLAAARSVASAEAAVAAIDRSLAERSAVATAELIIDRIAHAREYLALLKRQDTLLQHASAIAQRAFQAGQTPSVAVLTAEADLSESSVRRLQVHTDLLQAEMELRILCGDSAVTTRDSVLPRRQPPSAGTLAGPFLASAREQQELAKEQADYESTAWWPDLSLAYTNQSLIGTSLNGGGFATGNVRFQYATVGISLPLWFPSTQRRIEAAEVEQLMVQQKTATETTKLQRRVDLLQRELQALTAAMDHYDGPSAKRIANLENNADRAYETGDIGWSEHQEAIETALGVQMNRLDTLLRYNEVVIHLEHLTNDK